MKPFISDDENVKEFTLAPIFMGILLGIIFGASSLYLALKVGMTVSASIPIAVLSITVFRALSRLIGTRKTSILENNIVQTTGSAGESIAFGVAVTMPALLILGYDMEPTRVLLVSVLGGLLGVLMMIPLRRALIVKEHGELTYPEGTACAEVLIVGEKGGTTAKTVFTGFFAGLGYKFANVGLKLWSDVIEKPLSWFKGAHLGIEISPELLGVGYIIGPKIAAVTFGGGILAAWVLTPAIALFGEGLSAPLFPATKLISEMNPHDIWKSYILYIGAGAVAAGGIISLFQSLPTIVRSAKEGLSHFQLGPQRKSSLPRTEQDLPMSFVLFGSAILVLLIWLIPALSMNLLGALLIVAFGFLFVTVSSRLTGQIGSSSNPISGMTVATLLLTSLIFLGLGWVDLEYRVTALSVAAIVCIAASNGGTTSQDLKTGFLVGATPKYQQWGLLIGAFTSAIVIGYTLNLLNDASTVYSKKDIPMGAKIEDLSLLHKKEALKGPEAVSDPNTYFQYYHREFVTSGTMAQVPVGKYLVDDNGYLKYLVDPGINGVLRARDNGTAVQKYEAPKARLMSLIIDGILTQKLPWGLVLLGVAISIVLELCLVPSLPFAVGVYLPLSVSAPIFVGGLIRWLVDYGRNRRANNSASEAESESSPGVLYSSGLIAGGSIAGILLAISSLSEGITRTLDLSRALPWLAENQDFALGVFAILALSLFWTGRSQKR